jgi:transcriptional regulator with XRE-family HTH domain
LTQAELADRLGTTQSAVARWEAGDRDPSFGTLQRIVRACDCALSVRLVRHDDHDLDLAQLLSELSPGQRIEHMVRWNTELDQLRS